MDANMYIYYIIEFAISFFLSFFHSHVVHTILIFTYRRAESGILPKEAPRAMRIGDSVLLI